MVRSNLTRKRRTRLRAIESGGVGVLLDTFSRFAFSSALFTYFSLCRAVQNAACSNESALLTSNLAPKVLDYIPLPLQYTVHSARKSVKKCAFGKSEKTMHCFP